MKKFKKLIPIFVFFLALTFVFSFAGQFLGLAVYFSLTDIPMENLYFYGLYDQWMLYRDDDSVKPFLQIGIGVSVFFSLIPLFLAIAVIIGSIKREEIHGSARLANDQDLRKSGLLETKPEPHLLLGQIQKGSHKGKYLKLYGQTFLGLSSPTGTGKGVCTVLPNLLNFSDSLICIDIKLENYIKTAGFRASQGQQVFLFCLDGYTDDELDREKGKFRTHRWNPYFYVRRDLGFRSGDLLILANSLYPKTGDPKSDVWISAASNVFLSLSLWMLDTEHIFKKTPTLPYLLSLRRIEGGLLSFMKREMNNDYISDDCREGFSEFVSLHKDGQSSVMLSFDSPMTGLSDKTACDALSGNDFDFHDLRRKGISIYVGIQPPNIAKFSVFLNLFMEQAISENLRSLPENDPTLTHQLLIVLDELPALGRMNVLLDTIAFTRQYNVRYLLIYQGKSRLEEKKLYGKEGADHIIKNLGTEIIFPPKTVDDRVKEISETIGYKTVWVESKSVSKGRGLTTGRNKTPQKRHVLMPQEIVELGFEKHENADIGLYSLILKENQRPFIANKIISFDNDLFSERIKFSKSNLPVIPYL